MKIDVHTHTKKTKAGDSENRNIDVEKFNEIIRSTDVSILAITNHNDFDLAQYNQFREKTKDHCQIWPGIELDVVEGPRRCHLIVIVNPQNVDAFNAKVRSLLQGKTPDNFTITIDETIASFDKLDCLYIAHYHTKKPNASDEDLEKLANGVSNSKRIIKEATNSISAGIYISHGHNSIHGSDVQNWNDYHTIAKELPELRLPVESFEQFCLLLEKDATTINTILDKKSKETIDILPFGIAETVRLDIYNDINIIFGSKGTGKTEILRALSKYYNDIGFKTEVYESSTKRLEDVFDIKGLNYTPTAERLGIEECADDFEFLRNVTEKNVTSLSSYLRYYQAEETNKISKSIAIKNYTPLDATSSKRQLAEISTSLTELKRFQSFVAKDQVLQTVIGEELLVKFIDVLEEILTKVKDASETRVLDFRSISLFNHLITTFVAEIAKKTGQPQKPITTGFRDYASNRIKVERSTRRILSNIGKQITPEITAVGALGEKGNLFCQTNLVFQTGNISDGTFSSLKRRVTKKPQKEVAAALAKIARHFYTLNLFEKIAELKAIDGGDAVCATSDLLMFKRFFTLDSNPYNPSNGESSMVLLHNELKEEKEIYIIDEPEKSLGNDYISEVIVPLLKERAQMGRKIIIATHDANIAVRTLPYNSIYRKHDINQYFTYTGNPFTNNLKCINKAIDDLDWKEISMKTLEGGRKAFGERGKIYGNANV